MIFDSVSFSSIPVAIAFALVYLVLILICSFIAWMIDRGYVDVDQDWRKDRLLFWIGAGQFLALMGGITIVLGLAIRWMERAGPALVMHLVLGLPLLAVFFGITTLLERFKKKVRNEMG